MLSKLKAFYYNLLDLATFKKGIAVSINDYDFRLPPQYYKYFPSDYEQANFSFFKKNCKPGMISLDIGAHIGLFSIYMQKLSGGQVYSFEPTPSTVFVLKKTIALNHAAADIEVIAAAVSDKVGKAKFSMDVQKASVSNSLVQYERTAALQTCEVDVVTIDDFVYRKQLEVSFIKIDAEGAELGVLKGAYNTIQTQRPAMTLAIHPSAIAARNENSKMIWEFLEDMHYSILYDGKSLDENGFCDKEEIFDVHLLPRGTRTYFNNR